MRKIEPINADNIWSVVSIHRAAYNTDHFSTLMNDMQLSKYYLKLCSGESNFSFLYVHDAQPVGFVICGVGLNQKVQDFLKENLMALFFIVLRHPKFWTRKTKALFTRFSKTKKKWKSLASVRILSIAVNPAIQRAGHGQYMLSKVEELLKEQNVKQYGLSVKKSNANAIRFYLANGFILENQDEFSEYYIKGLQ